MRKLVRKWTNDPLEPFGTRVGSNLNRCTHPYSRAFILLSAMPTYSGSLRILAGDTLRVPTEQALKVNYTTQVRTVEAWDKRRPRTAGRGLAGRRAGMELQFVLAAGERLHLLLYGAADFGEPMFQLQLHPLKNKTARKNLNRILDTSRHDYELAALSVFVLKST